MIVCVTMQSLPIRLVNIFFRREVRLDSRRKRISLRYFNLSRNSNSLVISLLKVQLFLIGDSFQRWGKTIVSVNLRCSQNLHQWILIGRSGENITSHDRNKSLVRSKYLFVLSRWSGTDLHVKFRTFYSYIFRYSIFFHCIMTWYVFGRQIHLPRKEFIHFLVVCRDWFVSQQLIANPQDRFFFKPMKS